MELAWVRVHWHMGWNVHGPGQSVQSSGAHCTGYIKHHPFGKIHTCAFRCMRDSELCSVLEDGTRRPMKGKSLTPLDRGWCNFLMGNDASIQQIIFPANKSLTNQSTQSYDVDATGHTKVIATKQVESFTCGSQACLPLTW
jgi:hypothetical protein